MFASSAKPDGEAREYINLEASLGKLLVVRPLEYKTDFVTSFQPQGTDVVFCDIASLDEFDQATGQPGKVYRSQAILQGHLKGTFKHKLGEMILGMLYKGVPTKGKPPYLWHDLIGDPNAVARAQAWVSANQSFLVPLQPSTPAPTYSQPPAMQQLASGGPVPYVAPAAARPLTAAQYGGTAPVSGPPESALTSLDQMRAQMQSHGDQSIPF